jgi:hypothetical protein
VRTGTLRRIAAEGASRRPVMSLPAGGYHATPDRLSPVVSYLLPVRAAEVYVAPLPRPEPVSAAAALCRRSVLAPATAASHVCGESPSPPRTRLEPTALIPVALRIPSCNHCHQRVTR